MQIDTLRYVYDMIRCGSGCALITAGLTYFISPRRERIRLAIGAILSVSGILFVYSVVDPAIRTPPWVGICIMGVLFLVMGQAIFEFAFFLLGRSDHPFSNSLVRVIGIAWTITLCALPAFDYILGLNAVYANVEDINLMGPFHQASFVAIYFWPLISSLWACFGGYIQLPSSGENFGQFRSLFAILISIFAMTACLFLGLALSIQPLYMAGNTLLELSIVVFYFFEISHPGIFTRLKKELNENRTRKNLLSDQDQKRIHETIESLLRSGDELYDSELDITRLAKQCGVSVNQMSYYFNACLGTGFASWHNDLKIKRALILLAENPDLGILEIAFDCGFGSKTAFNDQFKSQTGMTPREYRKSLASK